MKRQPGRWLFGLCFAAFFAGFGASDANGRTTLPIVDACFVTDDGIHNVALEVASKDKQRQRGLMGRGEMGDHAGMLFTYRRERSASHGFWMFQTLIPLDIAYIDSNGRIVSIRSMAPCPSAQGRDCPNYPSGQPFSNAVEMNAGYFEDRDINVGDRLHWPADDTCHR
ncbi:MAG: hypothetical protein HLUCCX14_03115 [Marinobacter excellens HL-55]|uniref:DUF192 domain-containing protein n=1 Tax=Marinobacter excellens HL-55 TaxID=1305731 RepID=A0A0P8D2X9_9GAMM|nr:MAG: hypothetical protein HLUCCX14_03115 [Marinobacter excellens HL-55]